MTLLASQMLNAGHDRNGNPLRAWVIYDSSGAVFDVIDEGYSGKPGKCKGLPELSNVKVSKAEYRDFLSIVNGQTP